MKIVTLTLNAGEALEMLSGINCWSRALDAQANDPDRQRDAGSAAAKLGAALRASFTAEQEKPVEALELSVRNRNSLKRMGIHTLTDLANITKKELTDSKNFGEAGMVELIAAALAHGVTIRDS